MCLFVCAVEHVFCTIKKGYLIFSIILFSAHFKHSDWLQFKNSHSRRYHITAFSACVWGTQLRFCREIENFLSLHWRSPLRKMQTAASSVNQPLATCVKCSMWKSALKTHLGKSIFHFRVHWTVVSVTRHVKISSLFAWCYLTLAILKGFPYYLAKCVS